MADQPNKKRGSKRPELTFGGAWDYAPAPEATDHVAIADRYQLFVGGEFVRPRSRSYFPTTNPATEQTLAEVAQAGARLAACTAASTSRAPACATSASVCSVAGFVVGK